MALLKGKTGPSLRLLELCWQIDFYLFHFRLRQLILLVMSKLRKVDEGFLVGYSVSSKAFKEIKLTLVQVFKTNLMQKKQGMKVTNNMCFPVWSFGSINPQNTDGEPEFEGKFEDFSDNNINEDNAAGTLVATVGQITPNSTNTFSVAELEDITYFDDEDDVGAEADFNNLETSIIVSPIPTTRVHKDHLVKQTIGDLSLATQTRSMTRVAKDQEEPKRVHQALKDPSWIKAMQEELLQFKCKKFGS
uniref:Uncharacterized protein n=1 Tax=Tanacetum cinerariifolium TaxID=118510 RepID=A0A699J274_TANCI|nr:hypothetical protein [Tanacetum cinerariifolium]